MSTTVRTLRAVLTADDQASPKLKQVAGQLDGITGALKGLGIALSAGAVFAFFRSAVKEAAAAELGVTTFSAAAKNAGLNVAQATLRAENFAQGMARTTTYTDDAAIGAQQLLVSIGRLSGDGLERATRAQRRTTQRDWDRPRIRCTDAVQGCRWINYCAKQVRD